MPTSKSDQSRVKTSRSTDRAEELGELLADGLLLLDGKGIIQYQNPAATRQLGVTDRDRGQSVCDVLLRLGNGDGAISRERLERCLSTALAGIPTRVSLATDRGAGLRVFEAVFSASADRPSRLSLLIHDTTHFLAERERLLAVQDDLPDGLAIFNPEGGLLECNREWRQIFRRDGVLPRSFQAVIGDEAIFVVDRDPEGTLADIQKGRSSMLYLQWPDDERHLQVAVSPLWTGERVTGMLATTRDITTLIEKTVEANEMAAKAQRHLRELSQLAELSTAIGFKSTKMYEEYLIKLVALVGATVVGVYTYEPARQGLVCRASRPAEALPEWLALSDDHLAARVFRGRRTIAEAAGVEQHLAVPIVHRSKSLGVIVVARPSEPFIEHDAKLLRLAATRLAFLIENATLYNDVNARRERWEAVFRFTDEGIVIFDREGRIVGFNPASGLLTRHSMNEAIGQRFTKIVKVVALDGTNLAAVSPIHRVLADGATVTNQEQLLETKGGERIWTTISYSPIFDDAGTVTSGLAIIRNAQKGREIEEIKSDFISIVSHELRTPLTAIKGFLSMVLGNDFGGLNSKQSHFLSLVYQSNQRMIDLVEDLLNASNIESGKLSLSPRPLAPEMIISEVINELRPKATSRQIQIKVTRRQRLPLVLADESRLHQILLNLIDNAIKYSASETEVVVDCRVQGDELVTSILDRGVGISTGQADRLFTKFGRIYNPLSVQAGGSGLGLYIVKNLVESHGGQISVANRPRGGSKFSFTLPLAKQLPLLPS